MIREYEISIGRYDPETGAADVAETAVTFYTAYANELAEICGILGVGYIISRPPANTVMIGVSTNDPADNGKSIAIAYWTTEKGFELTDNAAPYFWHTGDPTLKVG